MAEAMFEILDWKKYVPKKIFRGKTTAAFYSYTYSWICVGIFESVHHRLWSSSFVVQIIFQTTTRVYTNNS